MGSVEAQIFKFLAYFSLQGRQLGLAEQGLQTVAHQGVEQDVGDHSSVAAMGDEARLRVDRRDGAG